MSIDMDREAKRQLILPILERLLDTGWLTVKQASARLGLGRTAIGRLRVKGKLQGRICNDHGQWLYWLPESKPNDPVKELICGSSTAGDAI